MLSGKSIYNLRLGDYVTKFRELKSRLASATLDFLVPTNCYFKHL